MKVLFEAIKENNNPISDKVKRHHVLTKKKLSDVVIRVGMHNCTLFHTCIIIY